MKNYMKSAENPFASLIKKQQQISEIVVEEKSVRIDQTTDHDRDMSLAVDSNGNFLGVQKSGK